MKNAKPDGDSRPTEYELSAVFYPVPPGVAHRFAVLIDETVSNTKARIITSLQSEGVIAWNDPKFWLEDLGRRDYSLEKDMHHSLLQNATELFEYMQNYIKMNILVMGLISVGQ